MRRIIGGVLYAIGAFFALEGVTQIRYVSLFEVVLNLAIGIAFFYTGLYLRETSKTPPKKTQNYVFSIDIVDGTSYETYLSRLGRITEDLIRACPCSQIKVLVTIQKINCKYCSVALSMYDYPQNRNISFGKGFMNGNAQFRTDTATGFTTPNRAKDEILLQFDWYDIPKEITEIEVLDQGQTATNPLVVCRFIFGPIM